MSWTGCGPCGNVLCSQYGCRKAGFAHPITVRPLEEADLETVNRALGAMLRKQEEEIKELRATLLVAAGALKVAGYHESAERCMDTWRKRIT